MSVGMRIGEVDPPLLRHGKPACIDVSSQRLQATVDPVQCMLFMKCGDARYEREPKASS
jgi:hypothetical protein